MKKNLKLTIVPVMVGLGVMLGGSPASAQTVLGGNGLPTANVNSGTADQSNVAWADTESTTTPTSFYDPGAALTIATSGTVTDIRVWDVNGPTTGLSLLGANGSVLSSTYTVTPTTYVGGQSYEGSSGDSLPLYQVDFTVDLSMIAGQSLDVFLNGTYVDYGSDGPTGPFLAASAASTGTPFLWLDVNDPSLSGVPTVETWYSGEGGGTVDGGAWGPGWNQDSVGDVEALGTVPDGGSALMLLGTSLTGLVWLRRKV